MSDVEWLVWRLDADPQLASSFMLIAVVDRAPDSDRLRRRLERMARTRRRLRQRVEPRRLDAPAWVDDADFDVAHHLHRVDLGQPVTARRLSDLAAQLATEPWDPQHPLWHVTVVDGTDGGRGAVIVRLHHAVADGMYGVALAHELTDTERDPAQEATPAAPAGTAPGAGTTDDEEPSKPDPLDELVAGGLRLSRTIWHQIEQLAEHPERVGPMSQLLVAGARGAATQLADVEPARSPLWTERSASRHIETLHVRLAPVRDAVRRLGGTLNTGFLTAVAEAAGDYHRELGFPVDELRAAMAISTRTPLSGANAFNLARMAIATGEMDIAARFALVARAGAAAREVAAGAPLEVLAPLANALPGPLLTPAARWQSATIDLATSNLRGASAPMYVAGGRLLHGYPAGPIIGAAVNVTVMSYVGHLDIGIHTDTAAVERPALLRRCLDQAFRRLAQASSPADPTPGT